VAGGDLALVVTANADPTGWAGAITAEVEAALYEAEADLDADLVEGTVSAAGVGEQVRRALDRALRPPSPRDGEDVEPGSGIDRERQMILSMLAEKRITAEQAMRCCALEGEGERGARRSTMRLIYD
jgi:hypothetical protein